MIFPSPLGSLHALGFWVMATSPWRRPRLDQGFLDFQGALGHHHRQRFQRRWPDALLLVLPVEQLGPWWDVHHSEPAPELRGQRGRCGEARRRVLHHVPGPA